MIHAQGEEVRLELTDRTLTIVRRYGMGRLWGRGKTEREEIPLEYIRTVDLQSQGIFADPHITFVLGRGARIWHITRVSFLRKHEPAFRVLERALHERRAALVALIHAAAAPRLRVPARRIWPR